MPTEFFETDRETGLRVQTFYQEHDYSLDEDAGVTRLRDWQGTTLEQGDRADVIAALRLRAGPDNTILDGETLTTVGALE